MEASVCWKLSVVSTFPKAECVIRWVNCRVVAVLPFLEPVPRAKRVPHWDGTSVFVQHVDAASTKLPSSCVHFFFRDNFVLPKMCLNSFLEVRVVRLNSVLLAPATFQAHACIDSLTRINAMYALMCLEHLIVSKRGSVCSVSMYLFSSVMSFQYRHLNTWCRLHGARHLNVPLTI